MTTPADVHILTGFLGAGKTTLLNRILTAPTNQRIAVIVNEFGEIGIDHDLLIAGGRDVVEMSNGCICCSVNGDLVRGLMQLAARRETFDLLVIEMTGLADPAPVVQLLHADASLRNAFRLRSVVTMVDARHAARQVAEMPEARAQLAFADVVLVNKIDLATPEALDALEQGLRAFNSYAPVLRTRNAGTDIGALLNVAPISQTTLPQQESSPLLPLEGAGSGVGIYLVERAPSAAFASRRHSLPQEEREAEHLRHQSQFKCEETHHHSHMQTVSLTQTGALDGLKLGAWLQRLAAADADILRIKGILHLWGDPDQFWFQGVQREYDCRPGRRWRDDEYRISRLVFIGRDLDEATLREGFAGCVTDAPEPSRGTADRFGRWHEEIAPQRLDQIRFWMRQNFGYPPHIPILVKEVPCAKPGCPPIETAIVALIDDAPPQLFKVQASINDLTFDQVYDLMENPMPCC